MFEDWRGAASPYMQQRAADRPWLDARCPLDAEAVITLVRRTRRRWHRAVAMGQAQVARRDPIDHLENDVPLEPHDIFELDFLSTRAGRRGAPSVTGSRIVSWSA